MLKPASLKSKGHVAHSGQVGYGGLKISLLAEAMMPYADGETPVLGDYVKNDLEEPGTVTRLRTASNGDDFVSIRWDDGGPDSPLTPAKEFTLISRQAYPRGPMPSM